MHLHLGDGISVTYFGELMSEESKGQDLRHSYEDTKTETGYERTLVFTTQQELRMTVLLHTALPNAVAGQKATIYKVNTDGTRTKLTEFIISDNNSVCWAVDQTEKYEITY